MKKVTFFFIVLLLFIPINIKAISASSYIVMDMDNNIVLEGNNINESRLIASISKIMTCIIAIENGNLDEEVTVNKDILKAVGSSIYLEIDEKITLKNLLYGMMLRSGNDAAIMIANTISKNEEEFVKLMNEYAKKIGMTNTIFYNSNGLENSDGIGNKSSAYDMALLTSYAYKNEEFRRIFKTKNYTCKSDKKTYSWLNKNKLLKYDYITGGKTGYTMKAKRTLVTTGNINNINLVIVTLNDGNDWDDHLSLYQKISNTYINFEILNKDDFKILKDTLYTNDKLYIKNNINILIKKDDIKNLKINYNLYNNPDNDNYVGDAIVYLKNKELRKEPIYIEKQKLTFKNKIINFFKKIF